MHLVYHVTDRFQVSVTVRTTMMMMMMMMIKEVCDIGDRNRGSACSGNHVSVSHKCTAKRQRCGNSASWKSVPKLPISATNCNVGGPPNTACLQSVNTLSIFPYLNSVYVLCGVFLLYGIREELPEIFFLPRHNSPQWAKASSLSRLRDHTQTHTRIQ